MNIQVLKQAGLSDDQILVYQELLKTGSITAGNISKRTSLKRGLVYKVLEQLLILNLISKEEDKKKATIFKPEHPLKLKNILEQKAKETRDATLALEATLPSLIAEFNLVSGMPGVEYYEGVEGVKKTVYDSLSAASEILQLCDVEGVERYIKEVELEYMVLRRKMNKQKRIIVSGSDYNKKFFYDRNDPSLNVKYVNYNLKDFASLMMIYDNKISYVTFLPDKMMGVIIENPMITKMHRDYFNYMWLTAKK